MEARPNHWGDLNRPNLAFIKANLIFFQTNSAFLGQTWPFLGVTSGIFLNKGQICYFYDKFGLL